MTGVESRDSCGSAPEQTICEPPCRSADVQRDRSRYVNVKDVKRVIEFYAAPADESIQLAYKLDMTVGYVERRLGDNCTVYRNKRILYKFSGVAAAFRQTVLNKINVKSHYLFLLLR